MPDTNIELSRTFFRGGEEKGQAIFREDVLNHLADALKAALYAKLVPLRKVRGEDHTYGDNDSFWMDATSAEHFPGAYIVLDGFHLTEWLPFAPGRYFTPDATQQRGAAERYFSQDRNEYTPEGKASMVRGGIGTIRLSEKEIGDGLIYFLGASSTGIAH